MFKQEKRFGLRKAKNMTTLVGCEVGTKSVKTVVTGAVLAGAVVVPIFFGGNNVKADVFTETPNGVVAPNYVPKEGEGLAGLEAGVLKDNRLVKGPLLINEGENPNSATNLIPSQTAPSEESQASLAKEGISEGELVATVESPDLTESVTKAEETGIKVVKEEPKTVANYEEAKADYAKQAEEVKAVTDKYKADKAEYDANLAKAQANTKTDGYLSKVESQSLIFSKEPNATLDVEKGDGVTETSKSGVSSIDGAIVGEKRKAYVVPKGSSLTATYTNLENSTYNGTKISKIVYTYTVPLADEYVFVHKDPTKTVTHARVDKYSTGKSALDFTFQAFDSKGNVISYSENAPAIFAINSLNNTKNYSGTGKGESIENLSSNLEFIPITGSSVSESNGTISATYNDYKSNGSRFDSHPASDPTGYWDGTNQANRWYGAGSMVAKSGDKISFRISNDSQNASIAANGQQWFALNSNVSALTAVNPTIPTVKVHDNQVKQKPSISKTVENDEDVNIHDKSVPKDSFVKYTLKTEPLKAGRKVIDKGTYVIVDNLPSGFDIGDQYNRIVDVNSDFDVSYDSVNHQLRFVANDTLVALMNADLTIDFDVIDPVVSGSPKNDNGTYHNNYSLTIGDYKVYSNTVTIYTPGNPDPNEPHHGGSIIKPTKKVRDTKGNDIDGKTVKNSENIQYVAEWDLDQYKDIVAGAVAIHKGFGYIDNYDEKAIVLDVANTTIKDVDGKAVTGLKAYVIKNLAEAPQEIKDLVAKAGIKIGDNDEFVIWVAENPEEFYSKYVVTGKDIFFTMPAKVSDTFEGDFENVTYQIDFGNGYVSNVVKNKVGKETPPPPSESKPELAIPVKTLPHTGDSHSVFGMVGALMLAVLAYFGLKKKEEA